MVCPTNPAMIFAWSMPSSSFSTAARGSVLAEVAAGTIVLVVAIIIDL